VVRRPTTLHFNRGHGVRKSVFEVSNVLTEPTINKQNDAMA